MKQDNKIILGEMVYHFMWIWLKNVGKILKFLNLQAKKCVRKYYTNVDVFLYSLINCY